MAAPICKTKDILLNTDSGHSGYLKATLKCVLTVKLLGFDAIVTTQLKYSSCDGTSYCGNSNELFRFVLNESFSSNIKSDEL